MEQTNKVSFAAKGVEFGEAINVAFSKYATFQGRASRSEYWWYTLFVCLLSIGTAVLDIIIFGMQTVDPMNPVAIQPIGLIVSLGLIIPGLSIAARRLHDTGRSGWWILLSFTIIGIIPLFIWYVSKGNDEQNKYD